jgi:hypothetical protein
MAGEQTVRGKDDSKRPVSVKETAVPKIKEFAGGKLGEAICEGLMQNEKSATSMVQVLRQETAGKVAEVSDRTEEQVRSLRSETFAAKGAVAEVRKQFGEKANVSEVRALEGRLESVEQRQDKADAERSEALEATTREVEVPTVDGGVQKKVLRGKELMEHTFAEIQGIKDTLNGVTEQVSQMDGSVPELGEIRATLERARERVEQATAAPASADDDQLVKVKQAIKRAGQKMEQMDGKIDRLKAAVEEAFSNVDGKLQLLAAIALGDAYGGEISDAMEKPSMKEEG